jgi:hypothetical protein
VGCCFVGDGHADRWTKSHVCAGFLVSTFCKNEKKKKRTRQKTQIKRFIGKITSTINRQIN